VLASCFGFVLSREALEAVDICLRPPLSLHERPEAHDGASCGGVQGNIDVLPE
jgi:hypothetical protein